MAFGRKNGNSSFVTTLTMYCNFKGPINTINIKVNEIEFQTGRGEELGKQCGERGEG